MELNDFEQLDELDATPMSTVFRLRHRRSGLSVAGKRIRKGCEVHHSGDYLNATWQRLDVCGSRK